MKYLISLFFSMLIPVSLMAQTIKLRVPITAERPETANYYLDLLSQALAAEGHEVSFEKTTFPQARLIPSLERDVVDLIWLVESAERNGKYIPIEVGLSNSLIGKRIMLIKKGEQSKYDNVKTLEDLKALGVTAGMGKGWFDTKVWSNNSLKYKEQEGNWRSIYPMVAAGRVYDYFPRGMNEIVNEANKYTDLDIEKNLVLQYDRDFRLYLSKSGSQYKDLIEAALVKARDSGLIDKLVKQYWAKDFEALSFDTRNVILLDTPN